MDANPLLQILKSQATDFNRRKSRKIHRKSTGIPPICLGTSSQYVSMVTKIYCLFIYRSIYVYRYLSRYTEARHNTILWFLPARVTLCTRRYCI